MATEAHSEPVRDPRYLRPIPRFIFASRWLQLPLYLGLIVAQVVYVFLFLKELVHLGARESQRHRTAGHADRAGPDRRGDDLQPADHGDYRRLRDLRVAHGVEPPSRPAGVARATSMRASSRSSSPWRSSASRRSTCSGPSSRPASLGKPNANYTEAGDHVAVDHPRPVYPVGDGHRVRRPHHAAARRASLGKSVTVASTNSGRFLRVRTHSAADRLRNKE